MATQELTFKINFDPATATREMKTFTTNVEASLRQVNLSERQQVAAAQALQRQRSSALLALWKQEEREAARTAQSRLREEARTVRQRIAEEQRAAREVARINAETARQAVQQERIRERAARQLADVQVREAKRAARELERSIGAGRAGQGGDDLFSGLGQVPQLSGIASQLNLVRSASQGAGAAQASMAGPIGLVVAGFLAEVGAAAALTKGLISAARETAAFKGALFDMSQQVGVSVETLSGLEILAKTTGGSIETVAASMAIFQRNLEDANDPTSKEAKLLADLGVTSRETEEALRQTLTALFEMGEGSAQTAAVLELFGRSGRFVNAILKESHGDLDKAIAKFRELGIIVSTEDAKAADEFNDSMAVLQFQLRGLAGLVGQEVMPIVLSALQELSKLLKENRTAVEVVGVAAKVAGNLIFQPFRGAIISLNAILAVHRPMLEAIVELYEKWAALIQLVTNRVPQVDPNAIPAQVLGEGRGSGLDLLRKAQESWLKAREGSLKPFNLREIFPERKSGSAGESDEDKAAKATEDFIRQLDRELALLKLENQAFFQRRDVFKEETVAVELTSAAYDKLTQSQKLSIQERAREVGMVERQNAAAQLFANFLEAQNREINSALGLTDQFTETLSILERQLAKLGVKMDDAQRAQVAWNTILKISLDHLSKINEEIDKTASNLPLPELVFPTRTETGATDALPPPPLMEGPQEAIDIFNELGRVISENLDLGKSGALAFADSLAGAFSGLANAVGDAVHAFTLFGRVEGGFRKFAAEVIASIAATATVQAIYEAAQGAAMVALTWFTGNPAYAKSAAAHFQAAAAFGLVAGVAVPLGRAVAGNTFQQTGAGGGGNEGTGTGTGQLQPLTLERNAQPQVIRLVVESNDSHIVKVAADNFRTGGKLRELIINDGVFTGG